MWNPWGPELLIVQRLCGTLGSLNFYVELGNLRVEPCMGDLGGPNF